LSKLIEEVSPPISQGDRDPSFEGLAVSDNADGLQTVAIII
jgi:hypothetical protein